MLARVYDDNFVEFLGHFDFGEGWSLTQNEIETDAVYSPEGQLIADIIHIDEKFAIAKANAVDFAYPFTDFTPFSRGSTIMKNGIEYERIGRSAHGFISYVRAGVDEDVYVVYANDGKQYTIQEIFGTQKEAEEYAEE